MAPRPAPKVRGLKQELQSSNDLGPAGCPSPGPFYLFEAQIAHWDSLGTEKLFCSSRSALCVSTPRTWDGEVIPIPQEPAWTFPPNFPANPSVLLKRARQPIY